MARIPIKTDAPLFVISAHYSARRAVARLPTIRVWLTRTLTDDDGEELDKSLEYIREQAAGPAYRHTPRGHSKPIFKHIPKDHLVRVEVRGAPLISFFEQIERVHDQGQRVALMATKADAGFIDICFDEDEYSGDGSVALTPPQYTLLTVFLMGMAEMIGWPAVLKVLHPETLALAIIGAELDLRGQARHGKAIAEQHAEVVAGLKELRVKAAEVILADDANSFDGTAKEFAELRARAAQILADDAI